MPLSFTMDVSERSLRRVQVAMAAYQAAEQTARAVNQSAQSMVEQVRKTLDEALGAICDAHDQTMPQEYNLSINPRTLTLILTDLQAADPGSGTALGMPPVLDDSAAMLNGADHANGAGGASPSILEDSHP